MIVVAGTQCALILETLAHVEDRMARFSVLTLFLTLEKRRTVFLHVTCKYFTSFSLPKLKTRLARS